MDNAHYLPMFLAECREHLQELNLAVVRLEDDPGDRDTIDALFRIAHSLKGMSATMGFEGMAALTHEMENVLELVRRRENGLTGATVDVLFACLDALSSATDAIDAHGAEAIDPEPLIAGLTALVRREDVVEDENGDAPAAPAVEVADRRVLDVHVTLAPDAMMPAVRAYQVLVALAAFGEILASDPPEADIEGFAGREVTALLACEHGVETVAATVRAVSDVADVQVAQARPEPAPAVEPAAAPVTHATVRVDAERLDQLMHLMGELVVQRTEVEAHAELSGVPELTDAMQELTRTSNALQALVMQMRMVPVESVMLRFPRLVRDVAAKLGKQVDLQLVGQDTELDRTVVDALGDPLVHLVRNALDHGLEMPQERVAEGKPATGTLTIAARHAGASIVVSVTDDGRGVYPGKVAAKAVERGLIAPEEAAAIDGPAAVELLFAPGFSTAETVGELSGRGVGMDAVRAKIRELGGEVFVTSQPGEGTIAEIRLPLTLAVLSALLVEADGLPYGIPVSRVERTLRLVEADVRTVAGRRVLKVDGKTLPLVCAAEAFGHPGAQPNTHVVVVRDQGRAVALAVSSLLGQRELVTRPLPAALAAQDAVAGAAVLPGGDIVLLADCDSLIAWAGGARNRRNRPRLVAVA